MNLREAVGLVIACDAPISRESLHSSVCELLGRAVLEERVGEELMRLYRAKRVLFRGGAHNPIVQIVT